MKMLEKYCDLMGVPQNLNLHHFEWEEADAHISPIGATPLKQALIQKTNCSLVLISAATLVWASKALSQHVDVTRCLQVAETMLCWQSNPKYYNRSSPRFFHPDKQYEFLEEIVVEAFASKGTTVFKMVPGHHTAFPNIDDTANLICLLRHILDNESKKAYKFWAMKLIERLNDVADNQNQDFRTRHDFESLQEFDDYVALNMGTALSPVIANINQELDSQSIKEAYSTYIRQVNWETNPYLNSPQTMIQLGFIGQPYS